MIEIGNVSFARGRMPVLRDICLQVPKGGVTALIGPNGAGKSTLLSLMARLLPLQSGKIAFDGLDISRTSSQALALKLAILRQDALIVSRMTVRELVGFGRYPHHRGRPRKEDLDRVESALGEFELHPLSDRFVDELSGGQRQRALLAMAFCQDTDYLLLDEPLNNLDMHFARALMRKLRDIADRHGRTVIVVLHEINYAAAHADRIVALKDGAVAAEGSPAQIVNPRQLSEIFDMDIAVKNIDGRAVALHHV